MARRTSRLTAVAVAAAALMLTALLCLAGCGGDGAASGGKTLRVGVRSDIVGFSYLNEETGNYYGLEVDIAEEMAARMGYGNVEFVTVTPDSRKQMLLDGQVDCLVACYSISDSRQENFDFSPTYYADAAVVMVADSSLVQDLDDMKGLTFGTMSGSNTSPLLVLKLMDEGFTSGDALDKQEVDGAVVTTFDNFTLQQISSYQELSDALEEGTVDAACMDGSIAQTYMQDDRHLLDFTIAEQEYGVATQKDSALSAQVAQTIQGMLDDGTIAGLIDKWD
ncbi:MAG: transporter substrate-binding domain-containing protein [Eggerthellaceae bacterium]|nr:transporter substrate-binding domain-containing protein [Eggerthellaceae bacterium]